MKIQTPTKPYALASIAALIIGSGAYGLGLFNADMALSEKGFYAMANVLSIFAAITVQKNVRDKQAFESEETTTV